MKHMIRIADEQDIHDLTNLFNSDTNLFGEDETGFENKDIAEYISDPRKKMFVCLLDSKLVGALFAEYHSTYVHLESLIVEKQFQKKGIGTQLFDHFENDISKSNIPLIEVLTEQNNSVMMKLLENRGFRKGNTFVFYSKGE